MPGPKTVTFSHTAAADVDDTTAAAADDGGCRCPAWHGRRCLEGTRCHLRPHRIPLEQKKTTGAALLGERMDMCIYQAIRKEPILRKRHIAEANLTTTSSIEPVMVMERILALLEADTDPEFRRSAGEDVMFAALYNNREDVALVIREKIRERRQKEAAALQTRIAELEGEILEYREIEGELEAADLPPSKLRKMLSKAIRDTERSFARVKETEATLHLLVDKAGGKPRRVRLRNKM
jgi:hypothetical protein